MNQDVLKKRKKINRILLTLLFNMIGCDLFFYFIGIGEFYMKKINVLVNFISHNRSNNGHQLIIT